ncbi:hypothetical protein SCYAM73S_00472 [Streptomyces cyaneofuscatus]
MARASGSDTAHRVYAEGVADFARWLSTEDEDGLARLSTLVGALVLARATKGSPISEEILTAAREALTDAGPAQPPSPPAQRPDRAGGAGFAVLAGFAAFTRLAGYAGLRSELPAGQHPPAS